MRSFAQIIRTYKLDMAIILLATCGSGLIALALGKDISWDLKNYHFYNPFAFLYKPTLHDILPADIQSYHNPLLDLPGYLLIRHSSPRLTGFIVGAVHGLNLWLIYRIALLALTQFKKYRTPLSILCALAGFFCTINFTEIGTFMNDNLISIFVLSALCLLIPQLSENRSIKPLIVSGLLFGIATGLKWTAGIYSVGAAITFISFQQRPRGWRRRMVFIGAIGAGTALAAGYWCHHLWQTFQNPVFPYFNDFFPSSLLKTRARLSLAHEVKTLLDALYYPLYVFLNPGTAIEIYYRDFRLPALYLSLFALGAHWWRTKKRPTNFNLLPLLLFCVVTYVTWMILFAVQRYLLAIEMIAPILFLMIWGALPKKLFIPASFIAFSIFFLGTLAPRPGQIVWLGKNWGRAAWGEKYFDVNVPALPNIENSVVVVGTFSPIAYIIPYFPPNTRFIRITGYMQAIYSKKAGPREKTNLIKLIQAAIASRDTGYLLYQPSEDIPKISPWLADFNRFLDAYKIGFNAAACVPVETGLPPELRICPLIKY